ncbi:poly(ADP-ribose) glycohydrolase-like isoform X2 [Belonocnema kinseyi]|nr:poly(ADP-ribose) glycohydrolase-like isoform X2 [Belonocnema kinseyi]
MSENRLNLEDEVSSPDLFSDSEAGLNVSNILTSEEEPVFSAPEPSYVLPEWKGVSLEEIYKGRGPFEFQELPHIHSSATHTVLFALPLSDRGPPKPYPPQSADKWSPGYVRMPHSHHSLYPIEKEGKNKELRRRWEIIQEALLQTFTSSFQLEAAIFSYNHKYAHRWDFSALHHFFSEVVDEDEAEMFFKILLPKIIQLALQLPTLITGAIPLLTRHSNASISLSQLQVASLLANAFLCTFPRRNSMNPQSEYGNYPYINFNKLFSAFRENRPDKCNSIMEKLKCIFHYFRRVTAKTPDGTITIQRRYIPKEDCPRWNQQSQKLPSLHITSKGTIETEGAGLLQVDFANMYVGGGVLGWGCVQEEIRFVICPELLVTMLVAEVLDDTEALVISGVERFSKYEGYSNSFKWAGDFIDETPQDHSGRRKTSVVAIDALSFKQPSTQFKMSNVIRELNKAYVGFHGHDSHRENLPAVATGNWGCGVFHGNPQLKVLLQLMAASVAGRSVVYFTFGDAELRDSVSEMYWHLVQQNVDIGQLFSLLSQYQESMSRSHRDFYRFLYNKSKMKPIMDYFRVVKPSTEFISETKSSKSSKTPEKRKYESSLKQAGSLSDVVMANLLDSDDQDLEAKLEAIEKEASQVLKGKTNDLGREKDFKSKENGRSREFNKMAKQETFAEDKPVYKHKSENNCKSMSEQNHLNASPKKKLSLWDLPVYKESAKSTKSIESNKDVELEDKKLTERDEENISENKMTETILKNESKEESTPQSKLSTIQSKNSPCTKKTAQKKISDFFLSNL